MAPRRLSVSYALLILHVAAGILTAQSGGESDEFTFFAVAEPQGPLTASHLRMHQPLQLLDLCRKVKAGAVDRARVAPLVGGNTVLDGLLARDLDALYEQLTAAQDVNSLPPGSLWSQILTNGGSAPPPRLDLPAAVSFPSVHPLDSPSQVLRVTAPADGSLKASLPVDSPFLIRSMRTQDGTILEWPRTTGNPAATLAAFGVPRFARDQAPWTVPVTAGQDVDVEIGLPAGAAIPAEGISSEITLGGADQGSWAETVFLTAQPALPLDSLYVYVDFPKAGFTFIKPPSYVPGTKFPFFVPLTLANPSPPANVKGTIKLASGPQGLSMPEQTFTLAPNGTLQVTLTLYVEAGSPAWSNEYSTQAFRIQVSYQTVPLFAAGSRTPSYGHFVVYPGSKHWFAKGNAGPIDCQVDLTLFSTGTLSFSTTCGNYNIVPGKAKVYISLGGFQVGATAFGLGVHERQWANWSISSSTFQTNYPFWQAQPMIVTWQGCTLC